MSDDATQTMQAHGAACDCTSCRAGAPAAAGSSPQASTTVTEWTPPAAGSFPSQSWSALLAPTEYRWNANPPGTPLTLTYGFMTAMPWYSGIYELAPFQTFTAAQQEGVHRAVALFEDVCNVDFVYTANGNAAQVRFGAAVLDDFESAHTYYPHPTADWGGDIWFNTSEPSVYNQSAGTYGFMVTLHEMGHALGLKHPFDTEEGGTTLPYGEDNRQYTVMSYYQHPTVSEEPASLLLYDIAALQYLYGANTSTRSGDTNYRWSLNAQFIDCIWDGGGNDTIDASLQTRRVIIDLNPGTFSSLGANGSADALNNLSIAFNVAIENAKGGSGNDTITGNGLANRLEGGNGNDTIVGGDGNDTLLGGIGNDILSGGRGTDVLDGSTGFDVVEYGPVSDPISINLLTGIHTGDAQGDTFVGIEKIAGTSSGDTFIGDAADNYFEGRWGSDVFFGGAGADTFDGGDGGDEVSYVSSASGVSVNLAAGTGGGGDAAGDTLISIESVTGSAFGDSIIGSNASNQLYGGAGDDTLDGGGGWDVLDGGTGNDIYYVRSVPTDVVERAGEGFDEIFVTTARFSLDEDSYVERVAFIGSGNFVGSGNSQDNIIVGGAGNDSLSGGDGVDTLIGGGGDDVLFGDGGDVLDGGDGFDIARYWGIRPFVLDMESGASDTFISIERIDGTLFDDTLKGNYEDNTFLGADGNDVIDGRGGNDTAVFSGRAEDYIETWENGVRTITPIRSSLRTAEGVDTLIDIETVRYDGTAANAAPIVNGLNSSTVITRNSTSALVPMFRTFDADSDSIQAYEFRDLTEGAGSLLLDGVAQAVNQTITVPAAGVYQRLQYHAGSDFSAADQIQVRVSDGVAWSAWSTLTLQPVNAAPRVQVNYPFVQPAHGTLSIPATRMFVVNDVDGDPITRYAFQHEPSGNGYFRLNGVAQTYGFQIDANQLGDVDFVLSTVGGVQDKVTIWAFDGYDWSNDFSLRITAPSNAAPTVSAGNTIIPDGSYFVAASALFTVGDADGDAMVRYEFRDNTAGNGYFSLNGTARAAQFQIDGDQLADLQFLGGPLGGTDQLSVRVNDGYAWSGWTSFTVTTRTNAAPLSSAANAPIAHGVSSVAASSLFAITDPDGDAIQRYRVYDGTAGNGSFRMDGSAVPERKNYEFAAADLANLEFRVGAPGTADVVWVQASDGMAWGAWTSFTVAAPVNNAPVVTVNTASLSPVKGTVSVAADSLFDVADADGDTITQYKFYDGTLGNGHFLRSGQEEVARQNHVVEAADLGSYRYQVSTTGAGDTLWVQAFDGTSWSAWKSFNIAAPVNVVPVVNVENLTPGKGTTVIEGADLFTLTDPDDANTAVRYKFYDGTLGNGRFYLEGEQADEQRNIDVSAAQLADLEYRTSATGGDTLWIQAFDGAAWSAWKSFTVAAPANVAPIIALKNLAPAMDQSYIAASSMFTVTDPDDAAMVRYRFYDGTFGNGRFLLNGEEQVERRNIEIEAADLPNIGYRASASGGDTLWVQAFDGTAWSAWKTFNTPAAMTSGAMIASAPEPDEPGATRLIDAMAGQIAAAERLTAAAPAAAVDAALWSEQRLHTIFLASA